MKSIERRYLEGVGDVYGKSFPSPQQERLLTDLKDLERKLKERKRQRYTQQENQEYLENQLFEIQSRYYEANKPIVQDLEKKIKEAEARYFQEQDRNATKNLLELRRWELRYSAMDEQQLKNEAQKYIKSDETWNVDRLTVLHKRLAEHGIKGIGIAPGNDQESGAVQTKPFYEWVEQKGGWRPWELGDRPTQKALRLYQQEFGKFNMVDESGKIWDFDISEALDIS